VDLFRFNYQTNERGYLAANLDMQPREFGEAVPPNMALEDEVGDFNESGTETTYKFVPQAGPCHSQTLRIWNGFNAGGRDVHFHTGNNFRCGQYRFVVDLTAYVAAGWKISEPQLFISPPGHGRTLDRRTEIIRKSRSWDWPESGRDVDLVDFDFSRRRRGCGLGRRQAVIGCDPPDVQDAGP
jgi:hypothetical protein